MPSVELSKLRDQLNLLAVYYAQPDEFMRRLRDLLERFADNGYRPGETIHVLPALNSYHLPHLVARQLELDLTAFSRTRPDEALAVIDRLWAESYLESRQYAIQMLGQLPLRQAEAVLERLNAWVRSSEQRVILELLLDKGTQRLRREGPDALLELYDQWLTQSDTDRVLLGLKALLPLVVDKEFENIPPIFTMLFPLVSRASTLLFNDLSAVLVRLAERTPTETVYFLRQLLSSPTGKNTPRLVRRILPLLSPEYQVSVKAALKLHAE
jgi:hypothetical protein